MALLIITLPLWLILLPFRPSQYDTWMNLLPNAAYLFNYDMLPTAVRSESWSFLPVAPYNTQFAAYLASVFSGAFAESAMSWFNVGLLLSASLLLAREIAGPAPSLRWWACASAALLVMPLNPGSAPGSP
jgi:hypothetical protein